LTESLRANSDNKPASAAVPNPAKSTTEDNGGARLAELEGLLSAKNGRIITLEKTLAGKSADVARLLSELDAAKKANKEPAKVVKEVVKDEAGRKEAERRAKGLADELKAAEKALQVRACGV
jgi:Flp pilus assembly CpaE family ATPase